MIFSKQIMNFPICTGFLFPVFKTMLLCSSCWPQPPGCWDYRHVPPYLALPGYFLKPYHLDTPWISSVFWELLRIWYSPCTFQQWDDAHSMCAHQLVSIEKHRPCWSVFIEQATLFPAQHWFGDLVQVGIPSQPQRSHRVFRPCVPCLLPIALLLHLL